MVGFLRKVALLLDEEISISGYITTGKSLFSTVNLMLNCERFVYSKYAHQISDHKIVSDSADMLDSNAMIHSCSKFMCQF